MPDLRPALTGVNLFVSDMKQTVDFYRRLGLTIDDDHTWGAHHVPVKMPNGFELEFDSVELTKSYDSGWQGPEDSKSVLVFSVATRDAVDQLYGELTEAGYNGQQPPFDAFWGARYAVLVDPDGNNVGVMSPSDDAHKSEPPKL